MTLRGVYCDKKVCVNGFCNKTSMPKSFLQQKSVHSLYLRQKSVRKSFSRRKKYVKLQFDVQVEIIHTVFVTSSPVYDYVYDDIFQMVWKLSSQFRKFPHHLENI